MKIRLASPLLKDSIVDGEGIRTVIWTQGCPHNCLGCHNPETHAFDKGFIADTDDINKELDSLELQDGITISGGDPFCQVGSCTLIAKHAKELGLNVWCYTGYTFEDLLEKKENIELLKYIDVLVDGRFILSEKSLDLQFKGSRNQRIIDVKKSLRNKNISVIKKYDEKKCVKQSSSLNSYIFI